MEPETQTESTAQHELKCHDCGAFLRFKPGTDHLNCGYCGALNEIKTEPTEVIEQDLNLWISNLPDAAEETVSEVKCNDCGASTEFDPKVASDLCPFCSSSLIVNQNDKKKIKPGYVLPFFINKEQGFEAFRKWLKALWWAPNDLKKFATSAEKLAGVYIPYWTYDSNSSSEYTGARGEYYYVTVPYTTTENGKTVSRTRTERRTRWHDVSGNVTHRFDDVLVLASHSLPREKTYKLEPWDLQELKPYSAEYLSGFKTENYQVGLSGGFTEAQSIMEVTIRKLVCEDIGGDEQRISTLDTTHREVTFKHVLLPVWISAYRYKKKVYRFMINGRTGEVQGERPYSFWKIFFAVLAGLIILGTIAYFIVQENS